MSYEIYVYHRGKTDPPIEGISKLLDMAGWKCAVVDGVDTLLPAALNGPAIAIGWEFESDPSGLIANAITTRDADALQRYADGISLVDVSSENPFEFEQEVIDEMRSAKIERGLITKARESTGQFGFRSVGASDSTVEFQWALASAVGVMVDGLLEDLEEGTLVDCADDED